MLALLNIASFAFIAVLGLGLWALVSALLALAILLCLTALEDRWTPRDPQEPIDRLLGEVREALQL